MASQALPYIPQFGYKPQHYGLHNASPEPVSIRWAGLAFTLPPADGFSHRPVFHDDGTPIPGTLAIADAYSSGADGNIKTSGSPNWFASDAVRNLLGIDEKTGEATGIWAQRGVSVLPASPSKEQVAEIAKEGRERYQRFLVKWAEETVVGYQTHLERAKMAGVAAAPPGRDYQKAVTILEQWNKRMQEELGYSQKAIEEIGDEEDLEFRVYALAEAMKLSKQLAAEKDVDQTAMAERLLEDPVVRKNLQRKYRIRRVGHMPEETEE